MTGILRSYAALVLALAVAVSSIGHAGAQAHGAQALVICTGSGLVRIVMDRDGTPVEHTMPCPDCVIALAAILAAPDSTAGANLDHLAEMPAQGSLCLTGAAGKWHDTRAPPHLSDAQMTLLIRQGHIL
ncbi:hypothetical protein [Roseinatronobacter monicus]|uniref:hypothetical protein n=1 Tax=Roseinatronobacter monicus TaxID=393481 RepID=UPI003F3EBE76